MYNLVSVNLSMKSFLVYCFIFLTVFAANAATTLNTLMYNPLNSNTVPTNVNIIANSVTAPSFTGSGTGTPYLLLASPNGASFGLSVNTNLTVQTTNKFDFSNVSAGQTILAHSSSAGQNVWTNGAAASSAYTLGGALVTTTVPSSAGITVGTGFTLHPTVSGLQQNASGAATAPLGRLYFHQNVVISHINLNGSSQIQTTTNLALMLMTNGVAATNMTAVLVGNDSRFVATNTTDTVTLLAGSYLTMLMTNNAGIPSANWVWSFKVTPQ